MSAEKEERERGEEDEGRMAEERGGVEEEKQQSHRVWTFISVTSGINFPPGAELGAGRHDFGGDYILSLRWQKAMTLLRRNSSVRHRDKSAGTWGCVETT